MGSTAPESPETRLFINNEYVNAQSGESFAIHNPYNDDVVAEKVQVAGKADVDAAVKAARAAFKGPWASLAGPQRAAMMLKFADLLDQNAEKLSTLETLSMGQPAAAATRIIAITSQAFRYYAGYADKLQGESYPAENGTYTIVSYHPLGVCVGLASWNATILYTGWKIAPALASGNVCIFKASEKSPLGALALGKLVIEAGFPPGVVQFLTGAGALGELLSSHMDVNKVSFTGSAATGRKVQQAASKSNMKRVTLELGGKSPALIFDDANIENALNFASDGFLFNSGQVCVAASRTYLQEGIAPKFIEALKERFEAASAAMGSNPREESTKLGPLADKLQFDRVMGYISQGKKDAQLITGGSRKGDKGYFVQPTIFMNASPNSSIYKEEIFGPVLMVKTFKTEEEAIELANDTSYGLSSCIYTSDVARALRVSAQLEAGTVGVNSSFFPTIRAPFGGSKQSGTGRELGKAGIEAFMESKTININLNA